MKPFKNLTVRLTCDELDRLKARASAEGMRSVAELLYAHMLPSLRQPSAARRQLVPARGERITLSVRADLHAALTRIHDETGIAVGHLAYSFIQDLLPAKRASLGVSQRMAEHISAAA